MEIIKYIGNRIIYRDKHLNLSKSLSNTSNDSQVRYEYSGISEMNEVSLLFDNDDKVSVQIVSTLSLHLSDKLHSQGIYFFDNEKMLKEYDSIRRDYFESVRREKDFVHDSYLLSSIKSILPLCFTDYRKFIHYVGRDNFESFEDALNDKNGEKIYELVERIKENLEKVILSESVVIDTVSIMSAYSRIKGNDEEGNMENMPEPKK